MHWKKIGTLFSIDLTHCFFVRLISRMVLIGVDGIPVNLFFDKANVAAALDASEPNLRQVFNVAVETHVLLQIMN